MTLINDMNQLNRQFNTILQRLYRSRLTHRQRARQLNYLKQQYEKYKNKIIASYAVPLEFQTKRALIVGINYTGTAHELRGCIRDAMLMRDYLLSTGYLAENITLLTDLTVIKPTKDAILSAFKTMLMATTKDDVCWFSYSGHGTTIKDIDGNERTGSDQCLVSLDLDTVIDDELKALVDAYSVGTLFALFDSCFSGTALDLKYVYDFSKRYLDINAREGVTACDAVMISGCTDSQTSAEALINGKMSGALTWSFFRAIRTNPTTWAELILQMSSALRSLRFTQTPQLSFGNQSMNPGTRLFLRNN